MLGPTKLGAVPVRCWARISEKFDTSNIYHGEMSRAAVKIAPAGPDQTGWGQTGLRAPFVSLSVCLSSPLCTGADSLGPVSDRLHSAHGRAITAAARYHKDGD